MGRPRSFDWYEAARLYAACGNYADVARQLGVSTTSILRALQPELREKWLTWQHESKCWRVVCPACGGWATSAERGGNRSGLCRTCSALARSTTVRDDTLRCTSCRLWLPDHAFPRKAAAKSRRQRHVQCTACNRIAKRDWRALHIEHVRAYDRERKRLERERAKALA